MCDKNIRVHVHISKGDTRQGYVTNGDRQSNMVKVSFQDKRQESWILRKHAVVDKPAGNGNKVLAIAGVYKGLEGIVESTAKKLKGSWKIRLRRNDDIVLIDPSCLVMCKW